MQFTKPVTYSNAPNAISVLLQWFVVRDREPSLHQKAFSLMSNLYGTTVKWLYFTDLKLYYFIRTFYYHPFYFHKWKPHTLCSDQTLLVKYFWWVWFYAMVHMYTLLPA